MPNGQQQTQMSFVPLEKTNGRGAAQHREPQRVLQRPKDYVGPGCGAIGCREAEGGGWPVHFGWGLPKEGANADIRYT